MRRYRLFIIRYSLSVFFRGEGVAKLRQRSILSYIISTGRGYYACHNNWTPNTMRDKTLRCPWTQLDMRSCE